VALMPQRQDGTVKRSATTSYAENRQFRLRAPVARRPRRCVRVVRSSRLWYNTLHGVVRSGVRGVFVHFHASNA